MDTNKHIRKNFWRFFVPAVLLFVWLIPATSMAASNHVNLIGTLVPAGQQHNANVYMLKYGNHTRYLGVSQASMAPNGTAWSSFNGSGWTLLQQSTFNKLRLSGPQKAIHSLINSRTCALLRINGYLNDGQLIVNSVKPVPMAMNTDLADAWCKK